MSNIDAISESMLRSSLEPLNKPGKVGQDVITGAPGSKTKQGEGFNGVFEAEMLKRLGDTGQVRFSSHAADRIRSRKIDWSSDRQMKLERAVDRAAQKGARDSLVLMEDLALVVSVVNRTVVTAINGAALKENVFTNIDSAVIV